MMDQAAHVDASSAWPPYNIEKVADDAYRITLAVAGFAPDEIELTQNGPSLLVSGQRKDAEGERQFLHRGIAGRQFRQTFNLADHVKVTGARMENGLLVVELVREVPEALKPRSIPIGGASTEGGQDKAQARVVDHIKAA
jgi:molecular chaperone IbpA